MLPYVKNPRQISDQERRQLVDSIERLGFAEIPAINTDNKIVAGHQRLAVMKLLGRGQEEIDVRVPNRLLTPAEFDEYLIRSNKNTGSWDWTKLIGFDQAMLSNVGFNSKEIDKIYAQKEIKNDRFDPEQAYNLIKEPDSKIGEIYQLGEHRLMCGDATNRDHVEKLMAGACADMVFTDPPYNVDYNGSHTTEDHRNEDRRMLNDKMDSQQFYNFLEKSIANMMSVCNGSFYVCMSSSEMHTIKPAFVAAGGHYQSFIIWVKNTFTLGRADWQNKYEPILYGWNSKNKNHYFYGLRDQSNVWKDIDELSPDFDGKKTTIKIGSIHLEIDGPVTGRIIDKTGQVDIWEEKKPQRSVEHPTMKPLKLVARAITASSLRGQSVLDLFGGSGSTLIAAHQLGRKCFIMELDPKYCDVIRKRYSLLVGE